MSRWSRIAELAGAMRAMKAARERERWTAERMREHQSRALDALVRHVVERSPFYRERYAGLVGDAPVELRALPPLDKATLMANLDGALCDPRLRGRDLRAHLLDDEPLLGEYRVMASSGSTGTPSLYVYSRADWTGVLALFLRYNELCGVRPSLPRLRIAAIGAPSLASMTQRIAQSADVGVHRVLRLSVTDPIPRLVEALNAFRPQALNAYPSVAALLADEQLAGRLRIAPRIVSTSSELRTPETGERIERAFGVRPFDLYGTTEGLWGVDCEHHDGIHLFEDWCIVEVVDGERLLVTNLFNRTLPLIRFEVSDVVTLDREPCRCGRTLPRMRAIRGRLDDVLQLPGAGGRSVPVHPTQFSLVAGDPAVREFQVRQQGGRIVLRVALNDDADPAAADRIADAVTRRLGALGVERPVVAVTTVDAIERTAAGKLRIVVPEQIAGAKIPAKGHKNGKGGRTMDRCATE
jgi:phenylacetate-CoA ligase